MYRRDSAVRVNIWCLGHHFCTSCWGSRGRGFEAHRGGPNSAVADTMLCSEQREELIDDELPGRVNVVALGRVGCEAIEIATEFHALKFLREVGDCHAAGDSFGSIWSEGFDQVMGRGPQAGAAKP